ncbi:MAG: hypothetical protein R3B54_00110 [Bdellovibrionota bacterium]
MMLAQKAAAAQQQQRAQGAGQPGLGGGSYLHWIGLILVIVFGIWLAINIYQTLATKAKSQTPIQDGT